MSGFARAGEVLEFWFAERARKRWFATDAAFDAEIQSRFAALVDAAAAEVVDGIGGALAGWLAEPATALALVIVLDQFPRNLHRGSPRAFAYDALARQITELAIARGFDLATPVERRMFFYLPYEHSELAADQDRAVELFARWVAAHPADARAEADDQMTYVVRHREIIQRFGRFPHRNAVLGRASTPAELAFLQEPKSSF